MKAKFFLACTSFMILLSGCNKESQQREAEAGTNRIGVEFEEDDEQASHGVRFKAGEGLTIQPNTSQMLGIEIADVQEGKATRRIELPLRVFREEATGGRGFVLAGGSVDTNQGAFLRPGTEVSIAGPGENPVTGEIAAIEHGSAKLTGLAEVIVRIPRSDELGVGTFLDGQVTVTTQEDVVIIPKGALLKTAEGYFAYAVNGDSLFRTRINVGGQEGEFVEVTDGLYSGDRVVLQPIMSLWLAELQAIRGGKACADGH